MSARPFGRDGRHTTQDVAAISQVLDSLLAGAERVDDAAERAPDLSSPPGIEDLIARAVAELSRRPDSYRHSGGASPVLGSGVLQELIAARRRGPVTTTPGGQSGHVDERL
jgi:hypothetical protein